MPIKHKKTDRKGFAKEFDKASTLYEFAARDQKNDFNMPILAALGLVDVALIAYFIYSENYIGAFLFLMVGFTVFLTIFNRKRIDPKEIKCKIKTQGIQMDNILYPYENLKSFWIFYEPPYHQELSIRSKKTFMNYIKIPLSDEDPVKIREILLEFLPERKQEEALVDTFARNIGL